MPPSTMNTRPWFSHLASGLLLALFLLTVVSWAVSHQRAYGLGLCLPGGWALNVIGERQDLRFQAATVSPNSRPARPTTFFNLHPLLPVPQSTGFDFFYRSSEQAGTNLAIFIPHWFSLVLTGGFPAWHFSRSWRRRRRTPGGCGSCNYDLRGNPCAARCPECGTAVPGPPAPA